jgi:hypothetical protein
MTEKITKQSAPKQTDLRSPNGGTYGVAPESFSGAELFGEERPRVNWRLIIWSVFGTLLALIGFTYSQVSFSAPPPKQIVEEKTVSFVIPVSPTPTPTPSITPSAVPTSRVFTFSEPTSVPTPVPGGRNMILTPLAGDTGWVVSEDESIVTMYDPQNHFGDSFLYAGTLDGKIYHSAFQFDLRQVPRGTKIYAARLRLTGLRADQMADEGEWHVRLLDPAIDTRWRTHNYIQLHEAVVASTFSPILTPEMLGEGNVNIFEFTPKQIELLERRIYEGSDEFGRRISFRLDGPVSEDNNLFAWDSGQGPASKGKGAGPELFLSLGPPPEEPLEPFYVIITSTPTPEDIKTAVAISLEMTAEAREFGTATPLPPNWVTPFVVTPTPTPETEATAQVMGEMATAIALTTGEPPNLATATATPTYFIITSTPTPENVLTAAANALQITAEALEFGTATPFPKNWVTPVVVTLTPSPENTATVEYIAAVMLTTGTPTATPGNVQTATPTPVFIPVGPFVSPTPTATPSATPQYVPASLVGKIVFLSDREGATEQELVRADRLKVTPQVTPQPYVYDPVTGQLGRLTNIWPYDVAEARDAWSADKNYETYNKQLLWTNVQVGRHYKPTEVFAIHFYDYTYNVEKIVTEMGAGIAYDPVWSPVSNEIAFVSTETQNDEIWVIQHDGTEVKQLTRNEWEWDKHPSWSPDGQKIVFYSNRTGNTQLWIMNKDGSDQRLLMPEWNPYNDFDPVWIKYPDPVPPLLRQLDWRFVKPPEEVQNSR